MSKKYDFDYIIIGSGAKGRAEALKLAKSRKQVAVIEGDEFGGSELNFLGIPYQINLDFAHTYSRLATYPAFAHQPFRYNFPTIVASTAETVANLRATAEQTFKDAHVTIINGFAHFLDPNTVVVNGTNYTAANFVLATGSKLKTKEIAGLDTVNYLTPKTALKIRRLPNYIFVVGGGTKGVEIASYFAELGAKVIIMERAGRLLPREDKEVSATVTDYFENELGVMVITNSKVVAIEQDNLSKRVIFNTMGQEKFVRVESIVLATGSEPVLDYGLENAEVAYKNSGIIVDKSGQTSAKHISALGSATGKPSHALKTRIIRTFPEIATVGFNEYDLLSSDHRYKKSLIYFKDLPIGQIRRQNYGFVKLLTDASAKLLGASIVGENAGLIAAGLAPFLKQSVANLANAQYPPNSYSVAVSLAAKKIVKKS